jgi:cobalt-zinc-cadmium resistance protein CzcA
MMNSAVIGQIIILIVFIPILSLTGVEGKMFRPMALSFSFAIIGAMIMGLTWLPVAATLFLKPPRSSKRNLSDWFMDLAYKTYTPVIRWSCQHKRWVLGAALASLALTGFCSPVSEANSFHPRRRGFRDTTRAENRHLVVKNR